MLLYSIFTWAYSRLSGATHQIYLPLPVNVWADHLQTNEWLLFWRCFFAKATTPARANVIIAKRKDKGAENWLKCRFGNTMIPPTELDVCTVSFLGHTCSHFISIDTSLLGSADPLMLSLRSRLQYMNETNLRQSANHFLLSCLSEAPLCFQPSLLF